MPELRIDLHTHTTASDGSFAPKDLAKAAKEAGLSAIAVCDHDTTAGVRETQMAGQELGLEVVPGVEISALYAGGTMHILGYYCDMENPGFQADLQCILDGRNNRNPRIIARLNELGMEISLEDVEREAGGGVLGRPHFARAMMKKGYIKTVQEAFDEYLASNGKAFVPKEVYPPQKCVEAIVAAGGTAVLAHPKQLRRKSQAEIEAVVDELMQYGLQGVEAIHGDCEPETAEVYDAMARKRGLLVTGGSDFHGISKPDIHLGRGRFDYKIPYAYLEALKERRAAASTTS